MFQNLVANGVTAHIQVSCAVVHLDVVWRSVQWVDLTDKTIHKKWFSHDVLDILNKINKINASAIMMSMLTLLFLRSSTEEVHPLRMLTLALYI